MDRWRIIVGVALAGARQHGGDVIAMTSSSRVLRLVVVAALVLVLGSVSNAPSAGAAAGPYVTFNVSIGACFTAEGPPNQDYTMHWRRASGELKATWTGTTSDSGDVYAPIAVCEALRIAVGDTLRISLSSLGYVRTFTVPTLAMRIARKTSIVWGNGPASTQLLLRMTRADPGDDYPVSACSTTVTTAPSGAWTKAVAHVEGGSACPENYRTRGRDAFTVSYTNAATGDDIRRDTTVPYVEIRLGSTAVIGAVDPGTTVTIDEHGPAGALRGSAAARGNAQGSFTAAMRSGTNSPIKLRAGDTITGNWAGTVSFVISDVTISWSSGTKMLSGQCMPSVRFGLWVRRHGGGGAVRVGTTSANGRTGALDLSGNPLGPGDVVTLTCERAIGDQVSRSQTF